MTASVDLWVRRGAAIVASLVSAVWLGGLLALGAIAAPAVFSLVPFPSSADAMTVVFRRFDLVAMSAAAILLATEAARAVARSSFSTADVARACAAVGAAVFAVLQGVFLSPRIAALHSAGVTFGADPQGAELVRLHDWAKACGQAQLLLLAAVMALQIVTVSAPIQRAITESPS